VAGGLIEVELDDELLPPSRERRPHRRWSPRRWGRVAATLAVVLVAVSGVLGVDAARRAGRGGMPGFTSDLAVPRHEIWRADGVVAIATTPDLVVLQTPGGDGVQVVRAIDGATVWSVHTGQCNVVEIHGSATWLTGLGPARTADPEDLRVVCALYGPDTFGTTLYDLDGTILAHLGEGDLMQMGRRLVAVRPDEGAVPGVTVRVWSVADGRPLWDRHFDGVDATAGYSISDTEVTFPADDGGVSVDLATGEQRPSTDDSSRLDVAVEVPAGTVTSRVGAPDVELALVGADGRTRWTRDDALYVPAAVSEPGADAVLLALSMDNGLVALDAATGDVLWRSRADALSALVHLPGTAVLGGAEGGVVDDRTGKVLWTAPPGEELTAVSDRELVLLRSPATGELVVRAIDDGHEVLRYPAPDLPESDESTVVWGRLDGPVPAGDGILVVGSVSGVAALGP
jgi:outer membrane protein assembly factor BamB